PESRFIGIDTSVRQIDAAKEAAAALRLENLTLYAHDARDFDCGEIDYLVAHGVYSTSPPETQAAIWSLAARRLPAQGIAYVSYSVLPGWRSIARLRDLLLWGGRGAATRDRVRAGMQFARLAAQVGGLVGEPYGQALQEGVQRLGALSEEEVA